MFNILKKRAERRDKARALYGEIVAQSRREEFYADWGVPDTVDGRFEMIALNVYIVIARLNRAGDTKLGQKLFDVFFKTMDRSLREMGIGDLSVPKHMKRMMQGFNGRARNYQQAIENKNKEQLLEALKRNAYGSLKEEGQIPQTGLEKLAEYMMASYAIETIEARFANVTSDEANAA